MYPIMPSQVGEFGHFAGHHCSWCFSPASLRFKLIAGNTGKGGVGRLAVDKAERTNLEYIYNLIKTGTRDIFCLFCSEID